MTRPLQRLVQSVPRPAINRCKHGLGVALAPNLSALAHLWGTDKAPGQHGYTRHYARHLRGRRFSVHCVLEIGIGDERDPQAGGNSLRMWRNYFPRATIYGVDLYEKWFDHEARIVTLRADQSDAHAVHQAVVGLPPLDLVVDDGSHIGSHIITTFGVLFPLVRPGGYYAIEDLETSYLPEYGGGPPGTPETAVALAKSLLDDVNIGPLPIEAIHAYTGLVLIQKAALPGR